MVEHSLILIVDDLIDNRLMVKMVLKNEKYKFIEATNGKEALVQAKKYNPDVILLDALMPIMNGYKFAKQLRKIEKFKRTPILMITSLTEKEDKYKAIQSGVNDFISKPFDTLELKIRCKSYANLSKINKEYILANKNPNTNLPNKLVLMNDIKTCKNPFMILFRIQDYEILQEFYSEELTNKIEIEFAKKIPNLLPLNCLNTTLYNTNEGEFAFLKDMKEEEFSYERALNICTQIHNNIHLHIISLSGYEYNLNIVLSFSYGGSKIFEHARASLNYAIKEKISIVFANDIIENIRNNAQNNIKIIQKIKKALEENSVISYFQPIYNNKTKSIEKYESLVRIIDEDGTIISPFLFLEIAKTGGYYTKITKRVLKNSFKMAEISSKKISINLSSIDIEHEKITNLILDYFENNPEIAKKITFELLEDENIKNFNKVKKFITKVKSYGTQIAIDDFGAGYSNFERLLEFKPDILKIDASLIKNIETSDLNKKIVKTMQNFAKSMGIKTVAEFVSNKNIFDIVNEIGIDYTQGYFIGKPKTTIDSENMPS